MSNTNTASHENYTEPEATADTLVENIGYAWENHIKRSHSGVMTVFAGDRQLTIHPMGGGETPFSLVTISGHRPGQTAPETYTIMQSPETGKATFQNFSDPSLRGPEYPNDTAVIAELQAVIAEGASEAMVVKLGSTAAQG